MNPNLASRSAASVALNFARTALHPRYGRLVPRAALEPTRWFLAEMLGLLGLVFCKLHRPWVAAYLSERLILPGMGLHMALRKH